MKELKSAIKNGIIGGSVANFAYDQDNLKP